MLIVIGLVVLAGLAALAVVVREVRARNMQIWLGSYFRRKPRPKVAGPTRLIAIGFLLPKMSNARPMTTA